MDPHQEQPTSQLQPSDAPKLGRRFDHHRLDAWRVALEALLEGEAICRMLPRGHGKLRDQLRRALQGAFTLTSEAAARTGADRACRLRWRVSEASPPYLPQPPSWRPCPTLNPHPCCPS